MTDSDDRVSWPALFDADEYLVPGKRPRRPKAKRTAPGPDVVAVRTDSRWRLTSSKTPGVLHAKSRRWSAGASATVCGLPGVELTFEDGLPANGCAACAAEVGGQA